MNFPYFVCCYHNYMINLAKRDFPEIEFHTTSEFTKN